MNYLSENSWAELLAAEFEQPYFKQLKRFVAKERATANVYPPAEQVFTALEWTAYEEVKVVILGQDPYHGPNQAHGLSFSVLPGNKIPPSLRNIYQELATDLNISPVDHGYLKKWAEEGVLLLNTVLTVREGEANSHHHQGWEEFTDQIIRHLSQRAEPVIFILWGKPAQRKINLIDTERHIVLNAPHPSPLSAYRGFYGSRPFSQVNQNLKARGVKEIDWQLPSSV